jgi:hypothetical protein
MTFISPFSSSMVMNTEHLGAASRPLPARLVGQLKRSGDAVREAGLDGGEFVARGGAFGGVGKTSV